MGAAEVLLRDVREDDLRIFFEHQRDPESNRMANFEGRELDGFLDHWRKIMRDETVVVRAVEVSGKLAGNVVSWQHDGERDVGYWIGREHWGRGIATAALSTLLVELPHRPLSAHVAAHNLGSIRVLEKCGFTLAAEILTDGGVRELRFELPV